MGRVIPHMRPVARQRPAASQQLAIEAEGRALAILALADRADVTMLRAVADFRQAVYRLALQDAQDAMQLGVRAVADNDGQRRSRREQPD